MRKKEKRQLKAQKALQCAWQKANRSKGRDKRLDRGEGKQLGISGQ